VTHATPPLIATIVGGFVLAFIFGSLAHRFRMPPLIGYMVAGIAMGPFTPGFHGDVALAQELADIGVILLMFGVGLHFSVSDLMSVRRIVLPGALIEMAIVSSVGFLLAASFGWSAGEGIILGLSLAVASTVVLMTALQERHLLDTRRGQIAVGWLVVEDVTMVLALVLIPALAGMLSGREATMAASDIALAIAVTLGKVIGFVVVMMVVGRRLIPWVLERIAQTGSRELFRLGVLAIALGFAFGSAYVFGVSFALGAFFAGMILNESELSHRAAEESLPLRDAFSVLFFVSVGMLFDPSILVDKPMMVLLTVLIIVGVKSVAAYLIVRALGKPKDTALLIAVSLGQIGEFSFILAAMGVAQGILSSEGRDLILSGAIISILINPFMFGILDRLKLRKDEREAQALAEGLLDSQVRVDPDPLPSWPDLRGHTVVVGFGRVGHFIVDALQREKVQFVVIEDQPDVVSALRADNVPALSGNALGAGLMEAANVAEAEWLLVAIPNPIEAGQVVELALELNPSIKVAVRAHSMAEVVHLERRGAAHIVMGEQEIGNGMARLVLASHRRQQPEPDIGRELVEAEAHA
jgi:CPA2 family monovalent cation:H+ antiporter-2